jgi:hypothetical protein
MLSIRPSLESFTSRSKPLDRAVRLARDELVRAVFEHEDLRAA